MEKILIVLVALCLSSCAGSTADNKNEVWQNSNSILNVAVDDEYVYYQTPTYSSNETTLYRYRLAEGSKEIFTQEFGIKKCLIDNEDLIILRDLSNVREFAFYKNTDVNKKDVFATIDDDLKLGYEDFITACDGKIYYTYNDELIKVQNGECTVLDTDVFSASAAENGIYYESNGSLKYLTYDEEIFTIVESVKELCEDISYLYGCPQIRNIIKYQDKLYGIMVQSPEIYGELICLEESGTRAYVEYDNIRCSYFQIIDGQMYFVGYLNETDYEDRENVLYRLTLGENKIEKIDTAYGFISNRDYIIYGKNTNVDGEYATAYFTYELKNGTDGRLIHIDLNGNDVTELVQKR